MQSTLLRILLVTLFFMGMPKISAYDFCVDGIAYNILSASELTCEVTVADKPYEGNINIPTTVLYNNKSLMVTSLGDNCFKGCSGLTSINLPLSITNLGYSCFDECSGLTSIDIPSKVSSIGAYCFYGCTGITEIEIPYGVPSIESKSFSNCTNLASILIPSTVTSLGSSCFDGCSSLSSIQLPPSVKTLGSYCFYGCEKLNSITIPKYCTIGTFCFSNCTNLSNVYIDGNLELGAFKNSPISELKIGEGCNYIVQAYLSHSTYINTDPTVEYNYPLYQLEYTDFTFPTSLKSLIIEDSEEDLNQELSANFISTINSFQYRTREIFSRSESALQESWCESLESLYIGRNLTTTDYYSKDGKTTAVYSLRLRVPNLKFLTIGKYLSSVLFIEGFGFENLEHLKCLNPIPPKLWGVSESQFAKLVVEVPEEALETYQSDPVWGKFWNLKGLGVDSISSGGKTIVGHYDISGAPVDENYNGLVIVRFSDGSTKKVLQK